MFDKWRKCKKCGNRKRDCVCYDSKHGKDEHFLAQIIFTREWLKSTGNDMSETRLGFVLPKSCTASHNSYGDLIIQSESLKDMVIAQKIIERRISGTKNIVM